MNVVCHQVLLLLRTYAFWQGDKRVLYGLSVYACVTIGAAVATNVTPTHLLPEGNPIPGCLLVSGRNSTFVYLFLLIFEIVILCLTAYKRFHSYRDVSSPIVYATYRDSMFYIACIICKNDFHANWLAVNLQAQSSHLPTSSSMVYFRYAFSSTVHIQIMLIEAIASDAIQQSLGYVRRPIFQLLCRSSYDGCMTCRPQITLHSVLASRIMFNLRKSSCDPRERGTTDSAPLSRFVYLTPGSESTGSGGPSGSSQGVTNTRLDVGIDLSGFECRCDPIIV
ncbi:hypothetical protein JVT61DRAFT_9519 [Boletus reticuloceps]|uniref:Uncharacterized protein n=1 Tax=Boletus reticuloceps TaxID=495285 RepID=A0A8I2YG39_9AGAM|nr:hypothetical protein JVT61DRAFT_9519 [Boletus reticuloceps]